MAGLPLEEALARLLGAAQPLPVETVAAPEAAGRIAADDLPAPAPVPAFARAAMDGYLCHEADVRGAGGGAPVVLRVSGGARPGDAPGRGPARGEAWWITTGAPLPQRGDRVLPIETVRGAEGEVRFEGPLPAKAHIARPGEEIAAGAALLARGEVIGAAAVGALAACGVRQVSVHRRPQIAVVATGDELVDVAAADPALIPGRIFNSNAVTLDALLRACGCLVEDGGIVRDDLAAIRARFAFLLERADAARPDVILSTGGVSVGRYDLVHRAWLDAGAERVVGRVTLKPGGPFFAGRIDGRWAVGLSGTPVACLSAFHLLVRPLLARLSGRRHAVRPLTHAVLLDAVDRPGTGMRALWGRAATSPGGGPAVRLAGRAPAGMLAALVDANVLVLLPAGTPALQPGSRVTVLALEAQEDRDALEVQPAAAPAEVLGVTGASGAGKTRLIVALLRALCAEGWRVAAVKHAAHGFDPDRPESDSARMRSAGAAAVVIAGPEETAIRIPAAAADRGAAAALAARVVEALSAVHPDLVLVEGFTESGGPVVQVGPPKPGTSAPGQAIAAIPAAGTVAREDWDDEARRAIAAVRAWLERRRPARA